MEWYWSYRSLPELADLSPKERKRIWRECRDETRHRPLSLLPRMLGNTLAPAFLLVTLYSHILLRPFLFLVIFLALSVAGDFLVMPFIIAAARPRLRLLWNRCYRCGYSLVGNVSGRCPECGVKVEKREVAE